MTKFYTLNDGSKLPWLAFGTGSSLYKQDAADLVRNAIDNGVTFLDGAQYYNNEETLGAGIKASGKPRSELFIVTKFDVLKPGQTVKEVLNISLAKLGLDYVDLFLIHSPGQPRKENSFSQWWAGMEEVKQAGLARSIGVSNFKVEDLKAVLETAKVVPAVNQIEFHPYVYKAAEPVYKFCQEHGILLESYGGLTPIVRVQDGPIDPVLASIRERLANAHDRPVSTGQVLTKWILSKKAVVVTTTTKASRIHEFFDVENIPDLTPEEIEAIETAGAKLHKRAFPLFYQD